VSKPQRIQLRRSKGWRMPPSTVKVDRATTWGNPFVVGEPSGVFADGYGMHGRAEVMIPELSLQQSLALYRDLVLGFQSPEMVPHAAKWAARFRERWGQHPAEVIRSALRGKNLACWCKIGDPCHADVLLEIANGESSL
jgi:hypothetical protein